MKANSQKQNEVFSNSGGNWAHPFSTIKPHGSKYFAEHALEMNTMRGVELPLLRNK